MAILRILMVVLVTILASHSQINCTPINTVTTSERGVTIDNPLATVEAPLGGGSITVEGDILRVEPEVGDKLYVVIILNKQGRPIYLNVQRNGLDNEGTFEIRLDNICKADKTYRAFAITSGGMARLRFTYTKKE